MYKGEFLNIVVLIMNRYWKQLTFFLFWLTMLVQSWLKCGSETKKETKTKQFMQK